MRCIEVRATAAGLPAVAHVLRVAGERGRLWPFEPRRDIRVLRGLAASAMLHACDLASSRLA